MNLTVHETAPGGEQWATEDGRYRWRLRYTWPAALAGEPRGCSFVMLNPSDGTHLRHDASLRRCVGYARREGCGWLDVVNLSPFRATQPAAMLAELASHTPARWPWWQDHNLGTVLNACRGRPGQPPPLVVLAWGAWGTHPDVQPLAAAVVGLLARKGITWQALGYTRAGQPVHPLRQPKTAPLLPGRLAA